MKRVKVPQVKTSVKGGETKTVFKPIFRPLYGISPVALYGIPITYDRDE